jgi:hypothetical protein
MITAYNPALGIRRDDGAVAVDIAVLQHQAGGLANLRQQGVGGPAGRNGIGTEPDGPVNLPTAQGVRSPDIQSPSLYWQGRIFCVRTINLSIDLII